MFHGGGAYFPLITNSVVRTTASLHYLADMSLRTDCLRTPSKALKSEEQILNAELLLLSGGATNWPTKVFQN